MGEYMIGIDFFRMTRVEARHFTTFSTVELINDTGNVRLYVQTPDHVMKTDAMAAQLSALVEDDAK